MGRVKKETVQSVGRNDAVVSGTETATKYIRTFTSLHWLHCCCFLLSEA